MNSHNLAGNAARKASKHLPTVLTVISGVGLAATAYLFTRAGMKAERLMQHEVRVNEEYENRYPTYSETALITWQEYVVPASVGVATLICLASASVLNVKRQATLMGAYALGERTWAKYRNKVQEMVGFDNEKVIRSETVKDVAAERKMPSDIHGGGETVYLDVFSGQLFRSDETTIRRGQENANERAEEDGFVPLNYFYDQIGARTTMLGELVGWSDGLPLDIVLTPITFEDGTEGFGLDYARLPFWGYHEV